MDPGRWRLVKELYQSAVDHAPGERDAFLAEACGSDAELRREVESLLAQRQTEGILDGPVTEPAAGYTLGPYQILEKIGAGGMGAVFKARDTRLDRAVAVKISSAEFSRRSSREARATSALNHPHICSLYDVGEQNGVGYLVMEYVEGETLAARLHKGPLPFDDVLRYGAQIADALAAAHAHGIVHRDLKPANVMLAASGVKVLDFGLAKVESPDESQSTLTASHAIVGTIAYMAPEQLEGKPCDARSDIFALGLLLYEMAAGRKAFPADSQAALIAAVMRGEAAPIAGVPPQFAHVVQRCLARDPARRWQSALDVKLELEAMVGQDSRPALADGQAEPPAPPLPQRRAKPWFVAVISAASLLAGFAACLFLTPPPTPDQSQYVFTPFASDIQSGAVWSPDGKAAAYAARGDAASNQVFVRRLDSSAPTQVTKIPEAATPFAWTPDSHRIFFRSDRQPAGIWSVAAVGGEPEPALSWDLSRVRGGGDVAPDGRAAAVLYQGDDGFWGVWISAPLGSPLKKYSPDPFASREVFNASALKFSPDGRNILLILDTTAAGRAVWLLPYPASRGRLPRRVLPNLPGYEGTPNICWMPDSRHVALSLRTQPQGWPQIWEADVISGKRHAILSGPVVSQPAVSPDGGKMLFAEGAGTSDIVSAGVDGAAPRVVITSRFEQWPAWAARQPVLAYGTGRNGPIEIWVRSGGADRPVVTPGDFPPDTTKWLVAPALSPEADRIVYVRGEVSGPGRLWISNVSGGTPVPLTNDTANECPGSWSPEGSWFAYTRVKDGKRELMKVKTTGQADPIMLKAGVASQVPSWSPTDEWIAIGGELISPDGKNTRALGNHGSLHCMFSANGKLVYGIRSDGDRNLLFSVDIASGAEKIVGDLGADFRPASGFTPGIRFSLAPDGKSFVYATFKGMSSLGMLEGFAAKSGLLARLGLR